MPDWYLRKEISDNLFLKNLLCPPMIFFNTNLSLILILNINLAFWLEMVGFFGILVRGGG